MSGPTEAVGPRTSAIPDLRIEKAGTEEGHSDPFAFRFRGQRFGDRYDGMLGRGIERKGNLRRNERSARGSYAQMLRPLA